MFVALDGNVGINIVGINVNEKDIVRSYRGKPGCMCGCRGEYSDSPKLGMRRLGKIVSLCRAYDVFPVMFENDLDGGFIISLPSLVESKRNVNYTIYVRRCGL